MAELPPVEPIVLRVYPDLPANPIISVPCVLCQCDHTLPFCRKFLSMSIKRRKKSVKKNKLCFNCLARSHTPARCALPETCNRCGDLHHTLLHESAPLRPIKKPACKLGKLLRRRCRRAIMPAPNVRARACACVCLRLSDELRRLRYDRHYVGGNYERDVRAGPTRLNPLRKRRILRARGLLTAAMRAQLEEFGEAIIGNLDE